jgi:sugar lactone lactonase YvrE
VKIRPDTRLEIRAGGDWGSADGKGLQASFGDLHGSAFCWGPDGALYLTDHGQRIRKLAADGTVTTVAGGAERKYVDGPAIEARFAYARGIAFDGQGNLYVADSGARRIRKVAPDGTVTTIAGTGKPGFVDGAALEATFDDPVGIAVGSKGTIYVLDHDGDKPRVRKITADGKVETIAKTESER